MYHVRVNLNYINQKLLHTCTIINKSNSIAKIIIIYRPHSLNFTNCITDLSDFVISIIILNTTILVDFNNILSQHICCPIHIHGNILDL